MISIKSEKEIELMKEGGRILAKIIEEVAEKAEPGITTEYLDKVACDLILKFGAKPSFKGYKGAGGELGKPFPTALCVSVNEELVHCIPSERILKEGDIVSLDLGILYNGFHSDMAITVPVGKVSPEAQRLIRITKKALKRGIKKVRQGITFGDVGNTIQRYVEGQGYSVIRDLCGHGIGKDLHEDPQIPNHGKRRTGPEVKEGMVFCLEPMVAIGDWQIKKAKDGYGLQTRDNSLCAHFEQTIAVTESGYEVLTEIK